ncbi:MAG: PQQ-binding-like beta-propeller repeat protein [Pirellulaceae bacterium]
MHLFTPRPADHKAHVVKDRRVGHGWISQAILAVAILVMLQVPESGTAQEAAWPQLLGPNRDGQVTAAAPGWPSNDWPQQLRPEWQVALGSGFGGSAVAGNLVLTLHRMNDQEILEATSLADGQQQWRAAWPATYRGTYNPDGGPRCVPVVRGDHAFCYGAAGDLACVRLQDGKLVWHRALRQEYGADDGFFGAGSTPLAIENSIIVCLGGKSAGIVSVAQDTGKTLWKSTDYDASYASPIAVQAAGRTCALVVTRLQTVLIDVASGEEMSSVRFGSRGPTVNAATPIAIRDQTFFLTASYGVGTLVLSTDNGQLVEQSRGEELFSQYNTPVLVRQRIIGIDGREDVGIASLKCLDAQTLETVWEQPEYGTAHLLAVGARVLTLTLDGELLLLDASADHFSALVSRRLPPGDYRALPAVAGKRLIVRCNTSPTKSQLLCVELP